MQRFSSIAGVVVAVTAVVVAGALRAALTPLLGDESVPFLTFFPAIALAALYGALFLAQLPACWPQGSPTITGCRQSGALFRRRTPDDRARAVAAGFHMP
jgi:hypothetical protein